MIITLLVTTFIVAVAVTALVAFFFGKPINEILKRVVPPDLSYAWTRYLRFAIYVVGIGGGVRVWDLEKYITAQEPYNAIVPLTSDRWVLEIYNTIIGALQSLAMVLLVFFIFALMAVVIVRLFEARAPKPLA